MSTSLNMLEVKGMQLSAVVSELNETFPPINPTPSDELSHIMYRAGQRSVVEWILNKMDD
jgi:hypothetical protein